MRKYTWLQRNTYAKYVINERKTIGTDIRYILEISTKGILEK